MAQNPQLFPNGMPVPFYAELFVLARDGVEFEVDKIPGSGKVKAKGTIYLSNIRMVFVATKPVGHFFAFDMPLVLEFKIFILRNTDLRAHVSKFLSVVIAVYGPSFVPSEFCPRAAFHVLTAQYVLCGDCSYKGYHLLVASKIPTTSFLATYVWLENAGKRRDTCKEEKCKRINLEWFRGSAGACIMTLLKYKIGSQV